MAVISNQNLTLADVASRVDSSGATLEIVEALNQFNPILDDAPFIECNQIEGHKTTIRTGLPEVTWRKAYGGVQPSKSKTATVVEKTGNLEAYAEPDCDVVDLNGGTNEARFNEDIAFLESMAQEMATTLFYGDIKKTPEKFEGLASRLSSKKAASGSQIILAGGSSGSLTSCYFVGWDKLACKMLYPKGTKAGLKSTDKGQVTVKAADGGQYEAYRTHYKWQCGLSVSDWRAVARVANIDVDDLIEGTGTLANGKLIELLIRAKNQIKPKYRHNGVLYVPTEVKTYLENAAMNKSSAALRLVEAADQLLVKFFDWTIKDCDAISLEETAVASA
nr:MAG TPA: major capsid protein [Caudoviricetes sp.]